MTLKSILRNKYKALRNEFKNSSKASKLASARFLNTDEYKSCRSVFAFFSFGSEIHTSYIINKAIADSKTVALPYMTGRPHEMVFIRINTLDDLVKNIIGIYEPIYREENIITSDENTIIITPGLVFDDKGGRIGYGGGYYDKYLSENKYMLSVGLAFDFQIAYNVVTDDRDVNVDMIITDRRTIYEKFN